ncbi:hypothetical protein CW304_23770 [Bacillus sp. UFRGS-B20]|nr:hypothetical protein CW304_23770 [Bacillus sp. UFRGS-B20]
MKHYAEATCNRIAVGKMKVKESCLNMRIIKGQYNPLIIDLEIVVTKMLFFITCKKMLESLQS